jgi:hypothetical protein
MSNITISEILRLLENAADLQYSSGVARRKVSIAEVLALVAIAQALEDANEMKKKELMRTR